MRKLLILLIFLYCIILFLYSCNARHKKFKEVNKKTTKTKLEKLKYLKLISSNYEIKKGRKNYIVIATIQVTNVSNKKIYWFKVLVNIFANGKLTHAIVYTPNYYPGKDGKMYYRILFPKQTGIFKIILGEQYNISEKPNNVIVNLYEVGDSIKIFKKIRVNPEKYFIPYTPE